MLGAITLPIIFFLTKDITTLIYKKGNMHLLIELEMSEPAHADPVK